LKNENSTVLVIKKNRETPKDIYEDFFINYRLVFENNKFIVVTSKGDYTIIKNLTPGDYKIVKRQSIYKKSWAGRGHDSKLDISFTMKPGEITILPYQITFALKETQRGVSQSFSVHKLSPERYEEIVEDLKQYENFKYWQMNKTTQWQQENLLEAAAAGNIESVQSLLNRGANVDARDWGRGYTALMWAAIFNHPEIVSALLAAGADVNAKDNNGSTALIWAAIKGYPEIIRILLSTGADLDIKDQDGMTALMMAAWYGKTQIVKMLLYAEADMNVKDAIGRSALALARDGGHIDIVEILAKAGAKEE
jgi:hypothetical protein